MTPGVSSRKSLQLRRAWIGICRWNSPSMFRTLLGLVSTSIIGESPATVMVSCRRRSFIVMSTWKVAPARIRMASRLNVAKPVSSAVDREGAGRQIDRGGIRRSRWSTPVCGPSISGRWRSPSRPAARRPARRECSRVDPRDLFVQLRKWGKPEHQERTARRIESWSPPGERFRPNDANDSGSIFSGLSPM